MSLYDIRDGAHTINRHGMTPFAKGFGLSKGVGNNNRKSCPALSEIPASGGLIASVQDGSSIQYYSGQKKKVSAPTGKILFSYLCGTNSARHTLMSKGFGFLSFWGNSGPVSGWKLTFLATVLLTMSITLVLRYLLLI